MRTQADGLFEEKLPPASLGNRQITLSTKIFPPLLTNETFNMQKYVQFVLNEPSLNNKSVPHVFYFITITKDEKLLMKELFHSHSGNLTLNLDQRINDTDNTGGVNIFAFREPVMGAWTSKNSNDTIPVQTPIFNEGGLYNFKVEILGIDNDTNIFKAINSLEFDSRLSIGSVYQYDVDYQNAKGSGSNNNNITIISYYDSIQDFSYSSKDEALRWYMPFNWDVNRLAKDQNILVHNEIQVPRKWFSNAEANTIGNDTHDRSSNDTAIDLAIGKVNDKQITGRSFVIDPFSSQVSITFHYILDKAYLMNLAQNRSISSNNTKDSDDNNYNSNNSSNSNGRMKFELQGFDTLSG